MKHSSPQGDLFAAFEPELTAETDADRTRRYWDLRGQAAVHYLALGECRTDEGRERRLRMMQALDKQADEIQQDGVSR